MADINILTILYFLILMLFLTLIGFIFTAEYKLQKLRYLILAQIFIFYSAFILFMCFFLRNNWDTLFLTKVCIRPNDVMFWYFMFSLFCCITYYFIVIIREKGVKTLLLFYELIGLVCVIPCAIIQFIIIQTMSRVPYIYLADWNNFFRDGFIGNLRVILSIIFLFCIINALFLLYAPKGKNISGYFVVYVLAIFIIIGFFYISIPLIFTNCTEYFPYPW